MSAPPSSVSATRYVVPASASPYQIRKRTSAILNSPSACNHVRTSATATSDTRFPSTHRHTDSRSTPSLALPRTPSESHTALALMPAQTHVKIQGDSPTPLHPHQHPHPPSIKHLTGEVLATAQLLQQQIHTLECLAHATEEREATLLQQRAKLQELLHLVTQTETAEVCATTSLRETLGRVRSGRDRSFAALQMSGVGASPAASPCLGLSESSSIVPPSPLRGTPLRGTEGGVGGGGGEGPDADPVDNPSPGSGSPKHKTEHLAEGCEGDGGEQVVGQCGEGEGTDGASRQAGSGGDAEDASQPLPQFASLRVKAEDDERERGAPQGDVSVPEADAAVNPGAAGPMDQDHCGEDGRARLGADTAEHGAGRVDDLKEVQGAGDGQGETYRRLAFDPRPTSAPDGSTEPQGAPTPSKQGNEPTEMKKAAVGSDGSWRTRKRMPERNGKEQMKGVSARTGSQQESKGKGGLGRGDIDGRAGGQQKRGGQRTPSPQKTQVPGDRVQPSPLKKAGKSKGGVGRRN